MCAINPKHKKRLILDVYTSQDIPKQEFDDQVLEHALDAEFQLNSTTELRWHLKETTQEAD